MSLPDFPDGITSTVMDFRTDRDNWRDGVPCTTTYGPSYGSSPYQCHELPPEDGPVFVPGGYDGPIWKKKPPPHGPHLLDVPGTMRRIAEDRERLYEFVRNLPPVLTKDHLKTLRSSPYYNFAVLKYKSQPKSQSSNTTTRSCCTIS
uniref:NADH dehydrogenase [ubiquinone] 1 alpha subcomplex subunit 7 n=1 Tax=Steinernema glaseri TaxID=37863 RepID=A0A1I7ZG78_9BILA